MSKAVEKDAPPPVFKDAQGREWHPVITVNTMRLFERETNCGAFAPETLQEIQSGGKIGKMVTLAFLSCKAEVKERSETLDEFCESFENDIQLKALVDATAAAAVLFFRSRMSTENAAPAGESPAKN